MDEKNKDGKNNSINWKNVLVSAGIAAVLAAGISVGTTFAVVESTKPGSTSTSTSSSTSSTSPYVIPSFVITFQNDDGTILQQSELKLGETPTFVGENPIKPEKTKEQYYDYTFKGWDKEIIAAVTNTTYTATYSSVHQTYKVIYYDEDGKTILDEQTINRGTEPEYTKELPVKGDDESYQYRFKGWVKSGSQEEGQVTFTACYDSAMKGLQFDKDNPNIVTGYIGEATIIDIPSEFGGSIITEIAEYAFSPKANLNASNITKINIPNTISVIGEGAFRGLTSLSELTLPDNEGFTTIESFLFSNCESLTSIKIPDSVTKIKAGVFSGCKSLTTLEIGKGVVDISDDFFTSESWINEITVHQDNAKYKNDETKHLILSKDGKVLIKCLTTVSSVTIPDSVEVITNFSFKNCSLLTEINLNNTKRIDEGAFDGCTGLKKFDSGKVETLGENIFKTNESLEEVNIGESLLAYDEEKHEGLLPTAFANCKNLKKFTVDPNNPYYSSTEDGCLYNKDDSNKKLIRCPSGLEEAPTSFAENLKIIGSNSFQNCIFEDINVPETVEIIEDGAFKDCKNLTELFFGDGVVSIGSEVISGTKLNKVALGKKIAYSGISPQSLIGCHTLKYIDAINNENGLVSDNGILCAKIAQSENINAIIRCPHQYEGFTDGNYIVPSTIAIIANYAFKDVETLSSIEIPDSVTAIGSMALSSSSLTKLKVNTGSFVVKENVSLDDCYFDEIEFASISDLTTGYVKAFAEKFNVETVNIKISDSNSSLSGFSNNGALKNVVINDNVETIENEAFRTCTKLESFSFESSSNKLKTIGQAAFENCYSLKTLPVMLELQEIGISSFFNCGFEEVDLSASSKLTKIGEKAFQVVGNHNLKTVKLSNSVELIGQASFANNMGLETFEFGTGLKKIDKYAFSNCSSLKEIVLPATLVESGKDALGHICFNNCQSLKKVTFTGTKEEWTSIYQKDRYPFQDCPVTYVTCSDGTIGL